MVENLVWAQGSIFAVKGALQQWMCQVQNVKLRKHFYCMPIIIIKVLKDRKIDSQAMLTQFPACGSESLLNVEN